MSRARSQQKPNLDRVITLWETPPLSPYFSASSVSERPPQLSTFTISLRTQISPPLGQRGGASWQREGAAVARKGTGRGTDLADHYGDGAGRKCSLTYHLAVKESSSLLCNVVKDSRLEALAVACRPQFWRKRGVLVEVQILSTRGNI
jgi:hypothetical protein